MLLLLVNKALVVGVLEVKIAIGVLVGVVKVLDSTDVTGGMVLLKALDVVETAETIDVAAMILVVDVVLLTHEAVGALIDPLYNVPLKMVTDC